LKPKKDRGLHLPIDFFFRSLAADMGERSVGVVLSGMGNDGTEGLKAIRARGGVTMAQEPESAKYDSMPRNAIASGSAEIVAPLTLLPGKLFQGLRRPLISPAKDMGSPPVGGRPSELEQIVMLIRKVTGHDFSLYKPSALYRRIERRMGLHHHETIGNYTAYLRNNPQELELLFKELLIGVTSFFCDPALWHQLRNEALPAFFKNRPAIRPVRIWVPGCSTGEEAYSLAMVCREALDKLRLTEKFPLQIFATDLDAGAVAKARQACFTARIADQISSERLRRFFLLGESGYRIGKQIREQIIFAQQNLIMDPPFTKLDIVCCRNLLIYLTNELQRKLLPLFHYCLNPGGLLLLGNAESLGNFTNLFTSVGPAKFRIFRRNEVAPRSVPVDFPSTYVSSPLNMNSSVQSSAVAPQSLQNLAERWLLHNHAPAAVLTNDQGDILFINGRTGRYLEPAAGKANWNVFVMAREELRYGLAKAFQKACRQKAPVVLRRVKLRGNGGAHFADVSVQKVDAPAPLRGLVMIVFAAVEELPAVGNNSRAKAAPPSARARELEQQLEIARKQLQATQEDMQNSEEELKSMNEELQSTNEELTTSKEEMQSLNEELQTVNAELLGKVDELSTASNDMKNLLNSTEIATLFLDNALHVRRFTEQATKIIKLIPGDIGRPVTDLASDLAHSRLADTAREVLRTLLPVEKELTTHGGRWFMMRVMPYRTNDNRIDGVVITFLDITAAKRLEAELRINPTSKAGSGRSKQRLKKKR